MKKITYTTTFQNKGNLTNIFTPTGNEWKSTENENLSVIESGKEGALFHKIIEQIKLASNMICLQSFLIQDTKIIDALVTAKQEKNIKVFILDAAEARLTNSSFDEEESFSTKDYKNMLNSKFKYNFIHRQAGNLHSKFILIDPKTNPKGFLFTGNFNKKPFFENPELAVALNKKQIETFFKVFVYHFWEHTTDEQTATEEFRQLKPAQRFEKPNTTEMLITSPDEDLSNLKNKLIQAVEKATKEITFSTFGFDIENELSQKILKKLKAGIKVTLFCRPREKAIKNNIETLAKEGANVICHPLIHAKSLLIDNKEGYIFTANFENHGMDTGFETGIKLNELQCADLVKITNNWITTFPFKYSHKKAIKDTETYFTLNNPQEKRNIKPINSTERKLNKLLKTSSEIIRAVEKIKELNSYKEKKQEVSLIFEINTLKQNYINPKEITDDLTEVTFKNEIKKKNKGKTEIEIQEDIALLLRNQTINNQTIQYLKLEKYKNINIFAE